jgi:hypothetical protein
LSCLLELVLSVLGVSIGRYLRLQWTVR